MHANKYEQFFFAHFSSAAIPVTLSCMEENNVVDKRVAQFILPIGTVTNAPGTAIYIAVSAMFIMKTFHSNLLNLSSSILIWYHVFHIK